MRYVEKRCCDCGTVMRIDTAAWKGDVSRIMYEAISCDACCAKDDDDEGEWDDDDDSAWRSEQPLRVAEGWVE
tara:strand:+ start:565 stop:783 length:219 start_codon:yes stop_codon:yes gene_type:complete